MHPFFQRAGRILALVALLGCAGGHWMVLQSLAWTTMLVEYTHDGGVTRAVEKTFDGAHPCDLCKRIEKGRQGEPRRDVSAAVSELILFHETTPRLVPPALGFWWQRIPAGCAHSRGEPPLHPPPRGILG